MKTTIDVPDDLYRKVKAKTALEGRAVRDVTIELYQRWLDSGEEAVTAPISAFEMMKQYCGKFDSGVEDLGSNSKHLEGFGE